MATKFKCNDGIYTVLRNGKAVAIGATAGEAITAITADAEEINCPEPVELGLRLTYTPGNLPANDLAAWNTFFDLPANGTAFTSMATAGDEVTLIGGAGITLKASLFRTSATLLKIEDDVDCVVAIAGGKNAGALSLCSALNTVTLNGVTTVAQEGLFTNAALTSLSMTACTTMGQAAIMKCTSITTISLPALTSTGLSCFIDCSGATTFTLPLLTSAGNSTFANCTSATTFTLPELLTAGANCFDACSSNIIFNLPKVTSAGTQCFNSCTSATTFTLPLLTSAGNSCFANCTAATLINIPLCTALGTDPTDATVFNLITGQTITLNVAAVNATNNAGGVHASIVYLSANNTDTINYI